MVKIEKEQKPIVAYTYHYKIKGKVFTPPGSRLSDFISGIRQKKFIPVADAVITDIFGNEICRSKFLELNKDEIIFLLPQDELVESTKR